MAITGAWAERQAIQSGAGKWGSGWNPIHAQPTGDGRNVAPQGNTGWVDPALVEDNFDYGYQDSLLSSVYGYGPETGTSDRPGWTEVEELEGFPSWGTYEAGLPGGTTIRSFDHGAEPSYISRNTMEESASAGWLNKQHGDVNNAVVSDPSQYIMTTSMVQRDQSRSGSQSSGRASEYTAPIHSRITGMEKREMVGDPARKEAMRPKEQVERIRPWWPRQAGTGRRSWLQANDMYASVPLQRQPPPDPSQGAYVGGSDVGWTDEDGGWY